jgi:hypothetical protein
VVNLGVYQGWSLYFICSVLRELEGPSERQVLGFDSFEGFEQGHERDAFCDYQTSLGKTGWDFYKDTSVALCEKNLGAFGNCELIEGNIRDTVRQLEGRRIALALFDMDDYSPTQRALDTVYRNLERGGVIIHDHYSFETICEGACIGQRLAMQEFLQRHAMFHLSGTNVFMKI